MKTICEKNRCTGCGACANICTNGAVKMQSDEEGFLYPLIEEDKCSECNQCIKSCQVHYQVEKDKSICDVYAIQLLDDKLLKTSTSGGVFAMLSKYVFEKGGFVFGAKYDDNMVVRHTFAETIEEIYPMQGSKYVQSDTADSYIKTREFLDSGHYVLYSGTPCQIEGLKLFLNKDYEKLITLDIICGGTPSPLLFKLFVESREKNRKSKIVDLRFRDKTEYGCSHTTVITEIVKDNPKRCVIADRRTISYYNAFGQQAYVRPSCYGCEYNSPINRSSDFTCGGYFGKKQYIRELDEFKGISQLIVHTDKGRAIFKELRHLTKCKSITLDDAKEGNAMLYKSMPINMRRPDMFMYLKEHGYNKTAKVYFPEKRRSFIKKIIPRRLKNVIKNIKR